ncbi:hypothetical protein [Terriglobus roseus]|uniref:Uncharacterized protein n=1 Tax=Terriglobus roseus TaxID=392734 RepID=A0A1G7G6P5_9BACT|nr:hypothetical protein [Terriglobus roseus]SDE83709.1 hypothetical protein SAMN05444167_0574 [Terriglobus roseus]
MPTVYFMGYVEPRGTCINVENLAPITELDVLTGRHITFTVAILESVVSVQCETELADHTFSSHMYTRAFELVRTVVFLIGLKMGWGLTVHIDTFIEPNGNEQALVNQTDFLFNVLDAYEINEIGAMFEDIACDVNLFMAISDLNAAISTARTTAVNCARVLDAIRHLITPGAKDTLGWKNMHVALNVEEQYLQYISAASKKSRHGNHEFLSRDETGEVLLRTWTIFNRYLHYRRKYAPKPLPLAEFSLLTSVSTP